MSINLKDIILFVALGLILASTFFNNVTDQTPIEVRTETDIKNEIELEQIRVQLATIKLAYEADEKIIESIQDSVVLDSTIVANADARIRDSLRTIFNPR